MYVGYKGYNRAYVLVPMVTTCVYVVLFIRHEWKYVCGILIEDAIRCEMIRLIEDVWVKVCIWDTKCGVQGGCVYRGGENEKKLLKKRQSPENLRFRWCFHLDVSKFLFLNSMSKKCDFLAGKNSIFQILLTSKWIEKGVLTYTTHVR